jgi:hypothetical protein
MTAPNTAPMTGRMNPRPRIVFTPDSARTAIRLFVMRFFT